jgi:hypothetical protein
MADIANFIAQNFRAPDLAGVDRARYSNALLRNDVDRLPQFNRAQDLAIQQNEQGLQMGQMELDQAGQKNALGIVGRGVSLIVNSQNPLEEFSRITADPGFQSAAGALKLPPLQLDPTDTPESIRAEGQALLQAIGMGQPSRLENPDIPSAVRVAEYYAGLPAEGDGVTRPIFNEANRAPTVREIGGVQTQLGPGASTQPLGSLAAEADARRVLAEAQASGAATGGAQGAAAAGLPDALADINKMRRDIQAFTSHPGFSTVYGKTRPFAFIPGSEAAGAEGRRRTLDAQAFSITIQKMRGLGALSNAEGQRVTDAFTHATNPAISEEEAMGAWGEVNYYLDLAEQRAQQKAGGAQPANTGGWTITEIR